MKKVIIVTYYWPPSGGGGVHRWLKLTKYLSDYGWEPIIYTPENPEYPAIDESLLNDIPGNVTVIKRNIWEPYKLFKSFFGKKSGTHASYLGDKKPGLFKKITIWVRGNMFIPDPRVFWVRPSINFLGNYINNNHVDAVITTGPPHSMHLIGLGLKKRTGVKWIADFRDPWTFIDYFTKLKISGRAEKKHLYLEKKVIESADKCVIVSPSWARTYLEMYGKVFDVVTNGFDETDFKEKPNQHDEKFTLSHFGTMDENRNPLFLWEVLAELCDEVEGFRDKLKLEIVGNVNEQILESIKSKGLEDQLEYTDYMEHSNVCLRMMKAQLLLLVINDAASNEGRIPGKLFEYLAAQRPILAIGKRNDAFSIMEHAEAGDLIEFDEKKRLKELLKNKYSLFRNKKLTLNSNNNNLIYKYSRRNGAREFVKILNSVHEN